MKIRIKQYQFDLLEPFREGHVMSAAEAQSMNNLRSENIRNNMASVVNDEVAKLPPGQLLGPGVLSEIQGKISRYDANYQFMLRHEPKPRRGAIEAMARDLAEAKVDAEARQGGLDLTIAEREALVKQVEALPDIQEEARRRVGLRQLVAAETLEALL